MENGGDADISEWPSPFCRRTGVVSVFVTLICHTPTSKIVAHLTEFTICRMYKKIAALIFSVHLETMSLLDSTTLPR